MTISFAYQMQNIFLMKHLFASHVKMLKVWNLDDYYIILIQSSPMILGLFPFYEMNYGYFESRLHTLNVLECLFVCLFVTGETLRSSPTSHKEVHG